MPRRPLRPLTMAVSAVLALTWLGSTAAATEIPVTGVVVAAPAPPRPSDDHIAAAGTAAEAPVLLRRLHDVVRLAARHHLGVRPGPLSPGHGHVVEAQAGTGLGVLLGETPAPRIVRARTPTRCWP